MLFADDLLPMSHLWKDTGALLEMTTRFGEEKKNPLKAAGKDKRRVPKIQGVEKLMASGPQSS